MSNDNYSNDEENKEKNDHFSSFLMITLIMFGIFNLAAFIYNKPDNIDQSTTVIKDSYNTETEISDSFNTEINGIKIIINK